MTRAMHYWLCGLLLLSNTGCMAGREANVVAPVVTSTSELVVSLRLGVAERRIAAVSSDIDHVVLELVQMQEGPWTTTPPTGHIKRIDKAALAAGAAQVSFSGLTSRYWSLRLTAMNAGGRVIGTESRGVHMQPGQAVHQVDMTLQLEPTLPPGAGGLSPTVTFSSPLPSAGTVTWGQLPQWISPVNKVMDMGPAGTLCVIENGGCTQYNAQGTKLGTAQFQPAMALDATVTMDAAGQIWATTRTNVSRYSVDGQRLANFSAPSGHNSLMAVDPSGNAWFLMGDGALVRLAPDGTVLSNRMFLQPGEGWRGTAFDPQTGDAWITLGDKLLKASSGGERVLTVAFPPVESLDDPAESQDDPNASPWNLGRLAVDRDGQVWVHRQDGHMFRVSRTGQLSGQFLGPVNVRWMFVDPTDHLWVVSDTDAEMNLTRYGKDGVAVRQNGLGLRPAVGLSDAQGVMWFLGYHSDPAIARRIVRLTP